MPDNDGVGVGEGDHRNLIPRALRIGKGVSEWRAKSRREIQKVEERDSVRVRETLERVKVERERESSLSGRVICCPLSSPYVRSCQRKTVFLNPSRLLEIGLSRSDHRLLNVTIRPEMRMVQSVIAIR